MQHSFFLHEYCKLRTAVPYRCYWLRNIAVLFTILGLIIVICTFSEEAELDGSTGKQDMA